MPDTETIVSTSPTQDVISTETQPVQTDVKSFVEEGMRNNGIIQPTADAVKPDNTVVTTPVAATPVLIPLDTFKEYGYDNQETLINDLKEYKVLKTAPPKVEPIKFENPESEALFKAWMAGDKDKVFNHLSEQRKLEQFANSDVDENTADEIIKLSMQVKYKDLNLTPAEIDYKFNKQFALPKLTAQGDLEEDADYADRKAAWEEQVADIKMSKIIEAKLAKPDLVNAKSKLIFPELNNTVDEGYTQYQKNLELGQQIEAEDREAYKAFTPKQIGTNLEFIDENNNVKIVYDYEPDAESFKQAVEMASNVDLLFKHFLGQDGKPDRQRFLKGVDMMLNGEKRILEAIKQSKNATIVAKLPDNTQGGLQRQPNQSSEPSPFQQEMDRALGQWNRNGRRTA